VTSFELPVLLTATDHVLLVEQDRKKIVPSGEVGQMKRTMVAMFAVMFAMGCDSAPTDTDPSFASGNPSGSADGKLRCFTGGGGKCSVTGSGAKLAVGIGGYAGVYYKNTAVGGMPLSDVTTMSFNYTGGPLAGGSPRFSIPIDETASATTAPAHAFISNGCVPNVVDAFVCEVNYKAQTHTGWNAFAAANPLYVLSHDIPFVIVDQPGNFVISQVVIN
jgi:hypothetical protein